MNKEIVDGIRCAEDICLTGSLSKVLPCQLLYKLATLKLTGILELRKNTVSKQIFLKNGQPVKVFSSLLGEQLLFYAVKKGYLSHKQRLEIQKTIMEYASNERQEILNKNYISLDALLDLENQIITHSLVEIFSWQRGTYKFIDYCIYPDKRQNQFDLDVIIYRGIKEHYQLEKLQALLSKYKDAPLKLIHNEKLETLFQHLGLHENEKTLLENFTGESTLEKLLSNSFVDILSAHRLTYFFLLFEMLESVDWTDILEEKLLEIKIDI